MLKLEQIADLQALHSNLVQESSTLEYKASPAIENTIERKREMAKDISAMANAEGGQFVYGMTEHNHQPAGLDAGINPNPFNGLWFEQVIQQNIQPPIEGLKILQIPVGGGNVATVITIPQSRTIHQIKDGRYYRRRNFRNDVMQDYEIREAFNRTATPELFIKFGLADQPHHAVQLPEGENPLRTVPFKIHASIGNRSKQPSFYSVVNLYSDIRLEGDPPGFTDGQIIATNTGVQIRKWTKLFSIPGHFPIFAETSFSVFQTPWAMSLPASLLDTQDNFLIGYSIAAPGYTVEKFEILTLMTRRITLIVAD